MLRITKTENGLVRGLPGTDARITVFKGIPYAADTSGKNRWRAPQPAENWEGVRDCFEFAPITMQKTPGVNPEAFYAKEWHVDPEIPMGENSLAVNIWTNAKSADEKKPVLVWIFGGALVEGYAHEMEFDGERIASRDVVLVSISYRLNVFGFLCHPEITAEAPDAPANFGFLDQQAALAWVQRNIKNFGGDPDNVTIFGQSAGGVSVFTQMCAPGSRGLFHKAIAQSCAGACAPAQYPRATFTKGTPLKEAETYGVRFFEEVLGVKTLEEARALDAFYIRDRMIETGFDCPRNVVDNKFLEKNLCDYLFEGGIADMPFIHGDTGDEFISGAKGDTLEEIEAWARSKYFEHADEVLAEWRSVAGDDVEAIKKVSRLSENWIATNFIAEEYARRGNDVYSYVFDPEMPGDDAGAFHSSELWFTFETLMKCWRPFDGHHYDLARRMCNYWTNFAKYGDPNGLDHDGTPMPKWEKYDPNAPRRIQLFDEISMQTEPQGKVERMLTDFNLEHYRK